MKIPYMLFTCIRLFRFVPSFLSTELHAGSCNTLHVNSDADACYCCLLSAQYQCKKHTSILTRTKITRIRFQAPYSDRRTKRINSSYSSRGQSVTKSGSRRRGLFNN